MLDRHNIQIWYYGDIYVLFYDIRYCIWLHSIDILIFIRWLYGIWKVSLPTWVSSDHPNLVGDHANNIKEVLETLSCCILESISEVNLSGHKKDMAGQLLSGENKQCN